jgi:hypothetical protein
VIGAIRPVGAALALAAAIGAAVRGDGDRQGPRHIIDVIVTGRDDGRARLGLGAADFGLSIGGRSVSVTAANTIREPLTLLVLSDISGTIYLEKPENAFSDAIRDEVVGKLGAGDRVRLGTFSRASRFQQEFSSDVTRLRTETLRLFELVPADRQGPSPIWDALDEAVTHVEGERGQRAIVLVTDGLASGNRRAAREVYRRAAQSGIPVFVIAEGGEAHLAVNANARRAGVATAADNLRRAAEATGGLYFTDGLVDSWNRPRPKPFFAATLAALRTRYRVEFEPLAGESNAAVGVRMRDTSLRAHYADPDR